MPSYRLVLASASPGRLATLRSAGLAPEVIVSGIDEEPVTAGSPAELAQVLASMKSRAVAEELEVSGPTVVVGCDSVLELDGQVFGKATDTAEAVTRWQAMRGRSGVLHSGHHVVVRTPRSATEVSGTGSTVVHFADITDAEIEAYVATGEPLRVAGAFTIDGLGGPFVRSIEGDPHNVVGLSLPLLRELLLSVGVGWTALWAHHPTPAP